jgi:hypothetical protein
MEVLGGLPTPCGKSPDLIERDEDCADNAEDAEKER